MERYRCGCEKSDQRGMPNGWGYWAHTQLTQCACFSTAQPKGGKVGCAADTVFDILRVLMMLMGVFNLRGCYAAENCKK